MNSLTHKGEERVLGQPMNLTDIVKTGHVKRWQIVRTHRDQTIAEHMYKVTMIAGMIWDNLGTGNLSIKDRDGIRSRLIAIALIHDLPEIDSGDLPTPFKADHKKGYGDWEALWWCARQTYATSPERPGGDRHCITRPPSRGDSYIYRDLIETLLSLADCVEALLFITVEHVDERGRKIAIELGGKIGVLINRGADEYGCIEWGGIMESIFKNVNNLEKGNY